jgi:hypothetical protein
MIKRIKIAASKLGVIGLTPLNFGIPVNILIVLKEHLWKEYHWIGYEYSKEDYVFMLNPELVE